MIFRPFRIINADVTLILCTTVKAKLFLGSGISLSALQAIMGHSNLETTKHYIALVEADIRVAQEKASLVRRLLGSKKRVR
jgi:integrase